MRGVSCGDIRFDLTHLPRLGRIVSFSGIDSMLQFDFRKSGRRCTNCEREFKPGEELFSALVECDDGSTERHDICESDWAGPTEDHIGWWKSRIPEIGKGRVYWAPKHVLLSYFEHVYGQPASADIAFVTSLLLIQKKILTQESDDIDDEKMRLKDRSSKNYYDVAVVDIPPERLSVIQQELSERLFMDQPEDADTDVAEIPND